MRLLLQRICLPKSVEQRPEIAIDQEQRSWSLKLPMRLRTSRKKVTPINLNIYRNLHFRSLTALKHMFNDHAVKLIEDAKIPKLGRIQLEYRVFVETKRELDIANVCSIVDKFFSDSLQHSGVILDDNWKYLDSVSFGFGGITDKEHVLVTINEIEPRKKSKMRIFLDDKEIQKALETFVETLGISNVTGVNIEVTADGDITAEVLVGDDDDEDGDDSSDTPKKPRAKKARGGRPAGSKNKPKEVVEDVETASDDSNDGSGAGTAESAKEEAETKADTPTEAQSKNLSGESPSQSSSGVDSPDDEEGEGADSIFGPAKVATKKEEAKAEVVGDGDDMFASIFS